LYEKLETDSKKSLYLGCTTVATYLTMGWRKQIKRKHVRLLGRKQVGVATNVYSRKMLEKTKEVCKFGKEWLGS